MVAMETSLRASMSMNAFEISLYTSFLFNLNQTFYNKMGVKYRTHLLEL